MIHFPHLLRLYSWTPSTIFNGILNNVYNTSFYGSNLWDLGADSADKLWASWNVLLKSSYSLPHATHRYISNGIYGKPHLKSKLLKRFVNFHTSIRDSDKKLIKVLFSTQHDDVRSTFGRNCRFVKTFYGADYISSSCVTNIPVYPIPDDQKWRIPLLHKLLNIRDAKLTADYLTSENIIHIINSLCCD